MYKMLFSKKYILDNPNIFKFLDDSKYEVYLFIRELIIIDIMNIKDNEWVSSNDILNVWTDFFVKYKKKFPSYFFENENENNKKMKIKTKLTNITTSNSDRKLGLKKRAEIIYKKEDKNTWYLNNKEMFFDNKKAENILEKILFVKKYKVFKIFNELTIKKIKTYCFKCKDNYSNIFFFDNNEYLKPNNQKFICGKCLEKEIEAI